MKGKRKNRTLPLDRPLSAVSKRAFDLFGAVALIILTLPLMMFAALGVRLSSAGPIIFKQVRVGKGGRKFEILKFRSMRVNGIADTAWTTAGDPRRTAFGRFIRKTSIDELPQLFNVLSGSMSLVGPRPEIPYHSERFESNFPLYSMKYRVKPGITGLAQIRGLRGDSSIEKRISSDVYYVENWTFFLDIRILLKTPFKAFNKNEC